MPKGLQINAVEQLQIWQNLTTKPSVCSSVYTADSNESAEMPRNPAFSCRNKALLPGPAAAQANAANRGRLQTRAPPAAQSSAEPHGTGALCRVLHGKHRRDTTCAARWPTANRPGERLLSDPTQPSRAVKGK